MIRTHLHFCSDCNKTYLCRITEPCHLYSAVFCLAHYIERQRREAAQDQEHRTIHPPFTKEGFL